MNQQEQREAALGRGATLAHSAGKKKHLGVRKSDGGRCGVGMARALSWEGR